MSAQPPFSVTPAILALVAAIGELVGRLDALLPPERQLLLRRANQIRTIQVSLAIEGNTLSLDQMTSSSTRWAQWVLMPQERPNK
jgi:Fic family protein